jgi:hypothetical protein
MARNRKQEGLESLFRGKAKEHWAAGMFTEWLWTTARPEPDIGADLVVEIPAHRDATGASFAVQSRSHKTQVRTETIERASALRLQGGVLPVFVLSVHHGSGRVRWMYIEPLFDTEPTYLRGGDLKVRMVDSQAFSLTDPAPPADFVAAIYRAKARGGLKATPSLRLHAQATEERYREIDPNFVVRPSYDNGKEVLTIGARDAPVTVQLQMELRTPKHKESVREAFEWGSAAHVPDSTFSISGSPLFEHISKSKAVTEMMFMPKPLWEGSGVLSYQDATNQSRTEVVDTRISTGTKGVQLIATAFSALLTFTLRIGSAKTGSARLDVTYALLRGWNVNELKRAAPALRLLEAAAVGRAFLLAVELPEAHAPLQLRWSTNVTQELDAALLVFQSAAALLRLARQQDWELPDFPMQDVSPAQMRTIIAAEALLRGEHVKLPPTRFSFKYSTRPGLDEAKNSPLTIVHGYELPVYVGDTLLGALPAWVMLRNYGWSLEQITDSGKWMVSCTPMEDSTREYFPPDQNMPKP